MGGQKTELKMIQMSEVESQEVKWLWYPFIPYGKLTIIQGDPGDGKTTLVLNIAAKLSRGECLDSDMDVQEPVNVIYQTAEDGLADTVKPRLEIAGADCEKILVIDESDKSLSMADERLEEALARTGAKVLILDPIQAYLGGGMDMNRANEARDMTKKLGLLAEKYKCAIILIGHMNKAAGNKAAYRGMGSIDFFAVARSVLLVGRIEGQKNTRAVVQIKNNLAAFGHSKAFELTEEGFHWLGDYEITADELLGGITPKANKKERAKQLIYELAETNSVVKSEDIVNLAEEKGISKRTLENAKKELDKGAIVILAGDLNEPSHLDWVESTKDMFEHNGCIVPWQTSLLLTESGFIDAFRQMYPDPATHPGLTWPVNNEGIPVSDLAWAAEADERDRIDYIYYYPDSRFSLVDIKMVGPTGTIVRGERVAADTQEPIIDQAGEHWPSDHRGLLMTIRWNE